MDFFATPTVSYEVSYGGASVNCRVLVGTLKLIGKEESDKRMLCRGQMRKWLFMQSK